MSNTDDIRELLEGWPYDPENDARIIHGSDGREVLQVRTSLGLEQFEMRGRPDGVRPHGMESVLVFYQQKLARSKTASRDTEFELGPHDCAELFAEGTLYYFRYLRLFQLNRWADTARDTARNLQLFDLVHRYAIRDKDREHLEKWRPYLLRMNTAASALQRLEQSDIQKALKIVHYGREQIEALDEIDDDTFRFERERSLAALRDLEEHIRQKQPVSELDLLQLQLRRAIERQEFERAAELRDRLRELKGKQTADGG